MPITNENGNILKAQQLCENLDDSSTLLTTVKRRLLEDLELMYVDEEGRRTGVPRSRQGSRGAEDSAS